MMPAKMGDQCSSESTDLCCLEITRSVVAGTDFEPHLYVMKRKLLEVQPDRKIEEMRPLWRKAHPGLKGSGFLTEWETF